MGGSMAQKLNSMRILEQQKIDYTVREFPDTIHSAAGVANYFSLPQAMVYKTLVVLSPQGKAMLVMVAGSRELNLKRLAKAIGQKKIRMVSKKEAERLTGLQTGGISALALKHKNFPVYIDRPALKLERILISAGRRGLNLELPVRDLVRISKAKAIEVTDDKIII
jgi:Cys-tRNA(Pro)/Cys-tRNA(Cys) deacylase